MGNNLLSEAEMGQAWLLLCLWLTITQACLRPPPPPPPPTSAPTTATSSNCRCGERKVVRTRIVGGQNAQKNEYPWQVGLVSNWGSTPFCGGSLISSTTIVTAAHCATSPCNLRLLLVTTTLLEAMESKGSALPPGHRIQTTTAT